jgi:Tfp pilus assembly protein PilX
MKKERGITLLISLIITGTLLLVATAIANIALKQATIAASGRDSQYAFYAADSGAECALYWDVKNPTGISAFATSTVTTINCNQNLSNPSNPSPTSVGGSMTGVSTFTLKFLPDTYCAVVTVTKANDGTTKIESLGYNTCDTTNPRRVERAVRVTY